MQVAESRALEARAGVVARALRHRASVHCRRCAAFVDTKRKLLDECELWCITSLPGGVFSAAGAGVKTNLLFFTKGRRTERIWYYDLSHVKVGKKTPMTLAHFGWGPRFEVLDDAALPATLVGGWREQEGNTNEPFPTFARLLAQRDAKEGESDFSWSVDFAGRRAKARADSAPHLAGVERLKNTAVAVRDRLALPRGSTFALPTHEEHSGRRQRSARWPEAGQGRRGRAVGLPGATRGRGEGRARSADGGGCDRCRNVRHQGCESPRASGGRYADAEPDTRLHRRARPGRRCGVGPSAFADERHY